MGILGKVASLAMSKAVDAAIETGKAQEMVNKVSAKYEKLTGYQTEDELLKQIQYKNKVIIRQQPSTSLYMLFDEVLERDSYIVFDEKDEPKYIIKGTVLFGKHHFHMKDKNGKEVGVIKKKIINIPNPLEFEKEVKSCTIEINGKKIGNFSRYKELFEKEYNYRIGDMTIEADKREKVLKVFSKNKENPIILIEKAVSDTVLENKYVVGFNRKDNEIKAILIAIGIDLIRKSKWS